MARFAALAALLVGLTLPSSADADEALADLVQKVAPSVVNIHTSHVRQPVDYWDEVFGGARSWKSLGSGFVVDDAMVITNHHVVAEAVEILIMDQAGRAFEAEVVGSDPDIDLALLRVAGLDLPAVQLGSSTDVRVGEDVFAVGNPLGHGHTVTRGILSARSRELGRNQFDTFLQTDAAINRGSSGGPLFDSAGRVIGINTAVDGRGEAVAFAMPVELVIGALPNLRLGADVAPGWPGLRLQEIRGGGLEVAAVYDKGPASKAGLIPGDVIVSIDGSAVRGRAAWQEKFGTSFPGEKRTLLVTRRGDEKVCKLVLESRIDWVERVSGKSVAIEGMNVSVRKLAPDVSERLRISGGVQVVQARRGSIFGAGDIVLEIDGNPIASPGQMVTACDAALDNRKLSAVVYRQGGAIRIHHRW